MTLTDLWKALIAHRAKTTTQDNMASKLKSTQPKISQLEHKTPGRLRVEELVKYADAMGLEISVTIKER